MTAIATGNIKISTVDYLTNHIPELKLVYLFGSYASEQSTNSSDVDIAILTPKRIPALKRWELQNELAITLNKDVDLVDLLQASTVMQNQVIAHGECLFDAENFAADFEMQVMSMYQHLNEERESIIKQYLKPASEQTHNYA